MRIHYRGLSIAPHSERGASLTEYALLVALIALIGIPAIRVIGTTINNYLNRGSVAMDAPACGGGWGESCPTATPPANDPNG